MTQVESADPNGVGAGPFAGPALNAAYILPIRRDKPEDLSELSAYLDWLKGLVEVVVVDGSPPEVFVQHAWPGVRHVGVDPRYACPNGKVAGVLTGLDLASHDRVVIADDDVRYDEQSLRQVVALLDEAEVVRPQNYFEAPPGGSLPWHARWDTARSLLNRALDGDWPGTLALRRSVLQSTGGYDGDCLFENLELVRTVRAAGGRELVAPDVFVRRLPPATSHFVSQRVRQAYDEFARPGRLAWQLALLPVGLLLSVRGRLALLLATLASIAVAEYGRRRDGGDSVFPAAASLFAPLWLLERGVCSWLALLLRLTSGGVRYRGRVIRRAATPQSVLDARHRSVPSGEQVEVAA